jgi:hypothetical protein
VSRSLRENDGTFDFLDEVSTPNQRAEVVYHVSHDVADFFERFIGDSRVVS